MSRVILGAVLLLGGLAFPGCHRGGGTDEAADVKAGLTLQPSPPAVGMATATVTLADREGRPVRGATVKLEGNMNHAGMTPAFADATEVEPGQYRADLELTMGGDWFVLISAQLPDGRRLRRKVDVPGVRSR